MPDGGIVGTHTEIGPTNDFEIVGQAGMTDGKIVRRGVNGFRVLVYKGIVRIAT